MLDLNFGVGGLALANFAGASDQGFAVAVQSDGKVVVAGTVDNLNTGFDFAVARFNSDGTLDTTFDGDGLVTTHVGSGDDHARGVAVQADGKIVVVGSAFGAGGDEDFAVVRYNSDGVVDLVVLTPIGESASDLASAVVLQSDGKIIVAGSSAGDIAVARYDSTGALDASFGGGVSIVEIAGDDRAFAAALQADGKIVVAGSTAEQGTPQDRDFAVVRLLANGLLDSDFGNLGTTTVNFGSDDAAAAVALQSDGKIVLAGTTFVLDQDFAVVRLTAAGMEDVSFNVDGNNGRRVFDFMGQNDAATAVAVQGSRILVGGFSTALHAEFVLLGLLEDGTSDGIAFVDFANGSNDFAQAMALDAGGRIVLAGWSNNGVEDQFAVARFLADGAVNQPPVADAGGPYTVAEGGSVQLDGAASIDPEMGPLVFEWDLDADGIFGESGTDAAHGDEVGATPTFFANDLDDPTIWNVTLRVTDEGGLTSESSATIDVTNVAPSVDLGADQTGTEGTVVAFSAGVFDPGPDVLSLSWRVEDGNGIVVAEGTSLDGSFTPADNGVYTVFFTANDGDGGVTTDTMTVNVANVAPQSAVVGPTSGVRGQTLIFSLSALDPSPVDQDAGFTYDVRWGDGTSSLCTGPGDGADANHIYRNSGLFTVRVVAIDKDGGQSTVATWEVSIVAVQLQVDPCDPTKTALVVGGTQNSDLIEFRKVGATCVRVFLNGICQGTFNPTGHLIAFGQGGDDVITVGCNLTLSAMLFGDAGEDILIGGGGHDLLVGGNGKDILIGGAGRDVLLGGRGVDVLFGDGQDLLHQNPIPEEASFAALCELLQDWSNGG